MTVGELIGLLGQLTEEEKTLPVVVHDPEWGEYDEVKEVNTRYGTYYTPSKGEWDNWPKVQGSFVVIGFPGN